MSTTSHTDQAETTEKTVVADAVKGLEKELASVRGPRRWLKRLAVIAAIAAVAVGGYSYRQATKPPPPARYLTQATAKRDIVEEVQSTGKVKPLKEVEVGAQVSGRIVEVYVDFNSKVKKGDLLAEIDPSLFGAQVSQTSAQLEAAKANVTRAVASLEAAKANLRRVQKLASENLASAAQVDEARGAHDVAKADVSAARAQLAQLEAQLSSARTTLKYTKIYSPIDGVVIDRAVDPGQTVAASFSAPVLFVIAQDLSEMQVLADVDEADVGKLEEGMEAEVVVDAFPGDSFDGEVTQIRYSPNDEQGVVTYSAVVDVENPELKLRPGMTATVTIRTDSAPGVTAVPNAALRFRPVSGGDGEEEGAEPPPVSAELEHGQARIYLLDGGEPGNERLKEKIVRIGMTDGVWTELKGGDLEPGKLVVTEQRDKERRRKFLGVF